MTAKLPDSVRTLERVHSPGPERLGAPGRRKGAEGIIRKVRWGFGGGGVGRLRPVRKGKEGRAR
jgi:hypothetical protein